MSYGHFKLLFEHHFKLHFDDHFKHHFSFDNVIVISVVNVNFVNDLEENFRY